MSEKIQSVRIQARKKIDYAMHSSEYLSYAFTPLSESSAPQELLPSWGANDFLQLFCDFLSMGYKGSFVPWMVWLSGLSADL